MEIKKRLTIFLIFIFIISSNIYSLDIVKTPLNNPFPSEENLNNFDQIQSLEGYDISDLEALKISLLTITPSTPIYSWFGHTAILVETKGNEPIVYDYGLFSFDSANFIEHFLQGKMYYLLYPSYATSRLQEVISENRTVYKTELNIPNEKKLDIINYLNYNARSENRTYLYDFYLDNCATRPRDILNWVSDGKFKQWAINQSSPYTFRDLSIKQLDNSLFINWVLNSFLGPSCDKPNTAWENMFSPEFLENAVIDSSLFNANQTTYYTSENATTFNSITSNHSHLLFYSLFAIILSVIGLIFKRLKQDHNIIAFGLYNSIITLFLLIISIFITFFVFFSNIQPAYNNENIFFINPIIMIILFVSSIKTINIKKNSNIQLFRYEKLSKLYSIYILLFLIVKTLLSKIMIQENYTIILPILLFFSIQSIIMPTARSINDK